MATTIMEREIREQGEALKNCLSRNLEAVAEIAAEAKRGGVTHVVLAARGSSGHAGNYFKYVLETLTGLPVSVAAPSTVTLYGGNLQFKNALVIGISQSGAAEDVMAVLSQSIASGALTVTVTNNLSSKMAAMGRHLYLNVGEEKSVAATKTFMAQMYILGLLAAHLADDKAYLGKLTSLPDALGRYIADSCDTVKATAAQFKALSVMIVLARGFNFPLAQEASLKLQETCYINARPYAASDFVHGPFAIVDDKTTLLLIAPKGNSSADMAHIKKRLLDVGAGIIAFTDDAQFAKDTLATVDLPALDDDFISPFYAAAAAQMFACGLSVARGLNPDAPRGLKKVTITK